MSTTLLSLGNDSVIFAFFSAVIFILTYTLMANWWRTAIGWARISLDLGIVFALSTTMAHLILHVRVEEDIGFAWYQIGTIAFVGFICLWNTALVIIKQIGGFRQYRKEHHDRIEKEALHPKEERLAQENIDIAEAHSDKAFKGRIFYKNGKNSRKDRTAGSLEGSQRS